MAAASFDYFVVLAGMRTGSNLLEEQINAMPGLESHGELFNPHFFGKPKSTKQFGLSLTARDADPIRVLDEMQSSGSGLHGFRLFYDHDPRVIRHVLDDRRAAKIILSRRPIDSYVSLKIARKTNQWWLGDLTTARTARVTFDAEEYADFLNTLASFQEEVARSLRISGQTAFTIDYEDLSDTDVVGGLGQFLGADGPPDQTLIRAKVQNPTPLRDRLTNPGDAEAALAEIGSDDLGRMLRYEPERGPGLRLFRACKSTPVLYMPIRGAGFDPIPDWLRRADPDGKVQSGFTQRELRRWKRTHRGHRGFTVLRHPLARAHDSFCRHILPIGEESYADIRHVLVTRYDVPLPENGLSASWSLHQHREAFLAFLTFLKGNLGGQTSLRVDNTWATQDALLAAIAGFSVPDRVLREDRLGQGLRDIAEEVGVNPPPFDGRHDTPAPYPLSEVVNDAVEEAAETAYRRDFMFYGFDAWRATYAA